MPSTNFYAQNAPFLFFQQLCQKLTDFNAFWCRNSWEKSHFSTVLFIQTSDYYVISEETNCNCCTAAYLFTYCWLLHPIICSALFYDRFVLSLWKVIFKATNSKLQLALFRVTNIWRNATLPAVRCKNFTFYKVLWWHFSGVVSKEVTVCFFSEIT